MRFKLRISQNKKQADKNCPEQFLYIKLEWNYLFLNRSNKQLTTIKGKTLSRGTNSRLPFGVNMKLNLSVVIYHPANYLLLLWILYYRSFTYIYAFVLSFVLYPRPLNYRVRRSSVFSLKAFRDVSRSSSKLRVKLVRKTREFIDR